MTRLEFDLSRHVSPPSKWKTLLFHSIQMEDIAFSPVTSHRRNIQEVQNFTCHVTSHLHPNGRHFICIYGYIIYIYIYAYTYILFIQTRIWPVTSRLAFIQMEDIAFSPVTSRRRNIQDVQNCTCHVTSHLHPDGRHFICIYYISIYTYIYFIHSD